MATEKLLFAGADFQVMGKPKLQANCLVFGDAGNGKTTFVTRYAPGPIVYINFDRRAEHAIYRATTEFNKKIGLVKVNIPANLTKLTNDESKKLGQAAVNKVISNFEKAVIASQKGDVRTICLDTATEYTEILRVAITGRLDAVKGDYGKSKDIINQEWWRLLNLAREGSAHFVILCRARAIWENNEPTGRFTFRGPEVVGDGVDWAGQIRLKKRRKPTDPKKFEIEITKAGINIEEMGAVYDEEQWKDLGGPFAYACWSQYPDTELESWT